MSRTQQMAMAAKFVEAVGADDVSDIAHLFTEAELMSGDAYKVFLETMQLADDDPGMIDVFTDLIRAKLVFKRSGSCPYERIRPAR